MEHVMQSKVDSSARALVEGASLPKCTHPLLICMGVCVFTLLEQMEHVMQILHSRTRWAAPWLPWWRVPSCPDTLTQTHTTSAEL
eukprot:1160136-Pelagomonas_calceolata.AAC.13